MEIGRSVVLVGRRTAKGGESAAAKNRVNAGFSCRTNPHVQTLRAELNGLLNISET
jgi:hypothetical protein